MRLRGRSPHAGLRGSFPTVVFVTHQSPRRATHRLATVAFGALLLAACSSGGNEDEAIEFLATTTTTPSLLATTPSQPSTTVATTATTEPAQTSTTQPPWTDEELAVIRAHDEFRASYFLAATELESDIEAVREQSTASYGEALLGLLLELRASGAEFEGSYDYETVAVTFDGKSFAVVTTCVLDNMARKVNGEVIADPLGVASLREALLEFDGDVWLVSGANSVGTGLVGQSCDL